VSVQARKNRTLSSTIFP